MLLVFAKNVGHIPLSHEVNEDFHGKRMNSAFEDSLLEAYAEKVPNSYFTDLRPHCLLASTADRNHGIIPSFSVLKDDIFCFLRGRIDNMSDLAKQFMLNKDIDHSLILTEAYRLQRRRTEGPETDSERFAREYHWLSFIKGARGAFTLVLYDHLKKTLFAAAGPDAHLSFYFGNDLEGNLILGVHQDLIKKACGNCFGYFPKGSYTSSTGLKSFHDKDIIIVQTHDSGGFRLTAQVEDDDCPINTDFASTGHNY